MNLFNLFAKISIDDEDYNSKIKDAESKFKGVSDTIGGMNKAFMGIGLAIGGVSTIATKLGMNFESQMSKVGAISGASADEMEKLNKKAKEMGSSTKYSATESGQAFEYMAMAGWKTSDMLNAIDGVMNLASASGEDLALVSDIVTDSMTAFGLSADKSAHFADVLASASSNSNTNVGMLGESFKYVAPLAGAMGYSIEDTSKALGLMANAGIKGSMSGTSLKTMLVNLANPTSSMKKAMDELGISLTNSDGSMKSLDEVMLNLRGSFKNLDKEQQAQYGSTIAGKEALSGLLSIVNASDADFDKMTNAVNNADGSAKKMADTMNDNLKGSFTDLGSKLEGLGIAFYEKFSEPLRKAVEKGIEVVDKLTQKLASGELDGLLRGIAFTVGTLGSMLMALNVVSIIQDLIGVFRGLNAVTATGIKVQGLLNLVMSMNPIGLVVIAIAGLIGAFATLWLTSESFRNFWIKLWEKMKELSINMAQAIMDFFTETIPNKIEEIKEWFNRLPTAIVEMWNNFLESCRNGIENVKNFFTETIPSIVNSIVTWFGELPYKVGFKLGELLGALIKWGIDSYNYVTTEVPKTIDKIVEFFSTLPSRVWTWFVETNIKLLLWGADMYQKGATASKNFIDKVINTITSLPSRFKAWLDRTVDEVIAWGSNLVSRGVEATIKFGNAIVESVLDLPSKFKDLGVRIAEGVVDGILGMASWVSDKVSSFFSGIVDGAKKSLGIHSPSRVFKKEIGVYMAQGVGVGFDEEMQNVDDIIQASLGRTVLDSKNAIELNGEGKSQGGIVVNQYYNKPINETESARLTRNELRKLTLGVI